MGIFSRKTKKNFELSQLKSISLGSNFVLTPVDFGTLIEDDLSALPILYDICPDIKEYLRKIDFSDVQKCKEFVQKIVAFTEVRL